MKVNKYPIKILEIWKKEDSNQLKRKLVNLLAYTAASQLFFPIILCKDPEPKGSCTCGSRNTNTYITSMFAAELIQL